MTVRIVQEPLSTLAEYARVPIAFEVRRVMDIAQPPITGNAFVLTERALSIPTVKDYDALPDEGPATWPSRFALATWALFAAYVDGSRAGGAAVVMHSTEIELLEGRSDLALLWDIRVATVMRRRGVGGALINGIESWASSHGARCIKVETQDVNVPACRFYFRNGFQLRAVHTNAYHDLPLEKQLLWYKELVVTQ